MCFNPCFSGCRPATVRHTSLCIRSYIVSILVLVDAALRHFAYGPYNILQELVSILVLVDAALRLELPAGVPVPDEFQSLF